MPVAHAVSEWFYILLSAGAIAVGWTSFCWLTNRLLGLIK